VEHDPNVAETIGCDKPICGWNNVYFGQ